MLLSDILMPVMTSRNLLSSSFALALLGTAACAGELHVATCGNDSNPGTQAAPLRTIQRGAELAQPGDSITVHEGVYRERITPPRGGESDARRIVYQAAPGERAVVKGSEVVKGWEKVGNDTWKAMVPNRLFGAFNPYRILIHGDWFVAKGRRHHPGAVYLNGDWLLEAATKEEVLKPVGNTPLWFADDESPDAPDTRIYAQFKNVNPNEQLVEINVRQTVFYPEKTGIDYLTVRGFTLEQAATPWAPPTAEQIGLIGTHWSKGWIIENNTIRYSRCSGVALGKYGDEWDNRAGSSEGYVGTIHRALANGWNKETIGHHVVRNNHISHCEQTGIVGSLGCAFSTVTGNTIHDIHVQCLFTGFEMAGIKFHGAIDVEISHNHIYRTFRGIWMDWMAQGTHVTGNLFHDNQVEDMFFEVDHGPFLVDNNILLSPHTFQTLSQGGAFVHNLIAGGITVNDFDARMTPFHKAHSTELAGLHDNPSGDTRFYNNLFVNHGDLSGYNTPRLPVWMDGNVFLKGATASTQEKNPVIKPDFDGEVKLVEKADGTYLRMNFDRAWSANRIRKRVTTELLGKAVVPNVPFEQPDGSPIVIDTDYFGKPRSGSNPTPGPFEQPGDGFVEFKVR